MLTHLSITNYALIEELKVDFSIGFTTITGETGAGKSILLDALGLALGNRADLASVKDTSTKCVIEAVFDVSAYELESLYESLDADYEKISILRREILPGGKSRAFINDSPVNLDALRKLGDQLLDIHSQHQTLAITQTDFQMELVDAMAGNASHLVAYRDSLRAWKRAARELQELEAFKKQIEKDLEYHQFQLEELRQARLKEGMQEELETIFEKLSNTESIKEHLAGALEQLTSENFGVIDLLKQVKMQLSKLESFGSSYQELSRRTQSVLIELDDIQAELQSEAEMVEDDPEQLEKVRIQLQKLYDLQKKHQTDSVAQLLTIQKDLEEKVARSFSVEEDLKACNIKLQETLKQLEEDAHALSERRKGVLDSLKVKLEAILHGLGMPHARFDLKLEPSDTWGNQGKDDLLFLFSANKGSGFQPLKKVASGGELSRIMLAVKSIMARYKKLPTIMFDEIDTGVSGDIAERMGTIMKEMGSEMQVFTITHLPQIAAMGSSHFKVFKAEGSRGTASSMKKVEGEDRVKAIAGMLSGSVLSEAALENARTLMQNSVRANS